MFHGCRWWLCYLASLTETFRSLLLLFVIKMALRNNWSAKCIQAHPLLLAGAPADFPSPDSLIPLPSLCSKKKKKKLGTACFPQHWGYLSRVISSNRLCSLFSSLTPHVLIGILHTSRLESNDDAVMGDGQSPGSPALPHFPPCWRPLQDLASGVSFSHPSPLLYCFPDIGFGSKLWIPFSGAFSEPQCLILGSFFNLQYFSLRVPPFHWVQACLISSQSPDLKCVLSLESQTRFSPAPHRPCSCKPIRSPGFPLPDIRG